VASNIYVATFPSHISPPTLLAREALQKRLSPVIIDNTNTAAWEMKPYVTMVSGGEGGKEGGVEVTTHYLCGSMLQPSPPPGIGVRLRN